MTRKVATPSRKPVVAPPPPAAKKPSPPSAKASAPTAAAASAPKAGQAGTQSGPAQSQVGQHTLLRQGARGDQVKQLQTFLKEKGHDIKDDGVFGAKTAAALRKYQADAGLQVDGVAGRQTWGSFYGETHDPGRQGLRQETSQPTGHSQRDTFDAGAGGRPWVRPSLPSGGKPWQKMAAFAQQHGFTVTSTTGNKHKKGSSHYAGRAIDVRTRDKSSAQVEAFIAAAESAGIRVYDERTKRSAHWSGPHLHLSM